MWTFMCQYWWQLPAISVYITLMINVLPALFLTWTFPYTTALIRSDMTHPPQWRRQDLLRGGKSWKVGHGALTANFRAGCSSCSMSNSFVTNAVLIERAVSLRVVDICTSWSRRLSLHNIWIVADLLQWECWSEALPSHRRKFDHNLETVQDRRYS